MKFVGLFFGKIGCKYIWFVVQVFGGLMYFFDCYFVYVGVCIENLVYSCQINVCGFCYVMNGNVFYYIFLFLELLQCGMRCGY